MPHTVNHKRTSKQKSERKAPTPFFKAKVLSPDEIPNEVPPYESPRDKQIPKHWGDSSYRRGCFAFYDEQEILNEANQALLDESWEFGWTKGLSVDVSLCVSHRTDINQRRLGPPSPLFFRVLIHVDHCRYWFQVHDGLVALIEKHFPADKPGFEQFRRPLIRYMEVGGMGFALWD